jgi:glycosyltransferase involved in cell wall biosynthesis
MVIPISSQDQSKFRKGCTAIVVTYNEQKYLSACLNSLQFCDQILVVDVGSTDHSVEIARDHGALIINHPHVPFGEKVRNFALTYAKNDWIILIDPDEFIPLELAKDIQEILNQDPPVAFVDVPWQFYFMGKPLKCTFWGRVPVNKPILVHKERVILENTVHTMMIAKDGYEIQKIISHDGNYLQHYWCDSYLKLFEKHFRYIRHEGEAKYIKGERFTCRKWLGATKRALKQNLFDYEGIKGGFVGIFLSLFYTWYINMSWLSLWKYQISHKPQTVITGDQ